MTGSNLAALLVIVAAFLGGLTGAIATFPEFVGFVVLAGLVAVVLVALDKAPSSK